MSPLPSITGVISDLDGVVYRGAHPIPGAREAFAHWRARAVPCCFVTNNSTRSAKDVAAHLCRLGVDASARDVVTSAEATADLLRARHAPGTPVQVIGSDNLRAVLAQAGFIDEGGAADIVVAGLDRQLRYETLNRGVRNLLAGASLIGTNPDTLLPGNEGYDAGTGTLLAALTAATGVVAEIVGKPRPHMIRTALARLGLPAAGVVMLGDRADTDIAAGQAADLFSILVGPGTPGSASATVRPDLHVGQLTELVA
ncbi:MAG: HAD-IIA family hydrolase [Celeribacter sp.]|jgi:4-nitrophenyl phosphatase